MQSASRRILLIAICVGILLLSGGLVFLFRKPANAGVESAGTLSPIEDQVLTAPGEVVFTRSDGNRLHLNAREEGDLIKLGIYDDQPTESAAPLLDGFYMHVTVAYGINLEKNRSWFALLDRTGKVYFGYLGEEAIYEKEVKDGRAQVRIRPPADNAIFDIVRRQARVKQDFTSQRAPAGPPNR